MPNKFNQTYTELTKSKLQQMVKIIKARKKEIT